uniref:Uncharacterized protein n=1 Tax=Kalanchoe fedtschenkoi TaxID=63787 RepID=A0A7N0TCI3_KALFE
MELQTLQSAIVSSRACLPSPPAAGPMRLLFSLPSVCHDGAGVIKFRVSNKFFLKSYKNNQLQHSLLKHATRVNPVFDKEDDIRHTHKCLVKATSGQPLESSISEGIWDSAKSRVDAFYRFSRPHTVKGTILGVTSMSLLAIEKMSDISPLFIMGVLKAMVVALCMNMYIVGINQLTDVDIDKVNKPTLPLASGEYSFNTGALIVASSTIIGFWLAWTTGSMPLLWGVFASFIIGTGYSANTHIFQRPLIFSRPLIFVTAFMSLFAVVIALLKDVPDLEGDKTYGIQTFTVRLGQKRVFWFCVSLLEVAYGVAICVGAMSLSPLNKVITILGHALFGSLLWNRAKATDLKSNAAFTAFYMFVWQLLYAEYLLFPLMR